MSGTPDDEERQLRIDLMRADIANKAADTALKEGLLRYEPWKVVTLAAGAGAGLMVAGIAAATQVLRLLGAH